MQKKSNSKVRLSDSALKGMMIFYMNCVQSHKPISFSLSVHAPEQLELFAEEGQVTAVAVQA